MSATDLNRLTVDVHITDDAVKTMADEVKSGLTAPQKTLPCKYFYDAYGSHLFEEITELPEYYQTRTELAILQTIADGLAEEFEFNEVLELGSGSAKKTTTLLDSLDRRACLQRYVPVDVSESMLRQCAEGLLERYERLHVHGVVGDFQLHLTKAPAAVGRRLVLFLGSTIGNLDLPERQQFLRQVRGLLGPQDYFLVGVDLVKDVARIEAAYNDSAGITADFNRNVLRVVNRELDGDFRPQAYRHYAFYNRDASRIEMHLIPETPQIVRIRAIDLNVTIETSDTIFTEISCKYTQETAAAALAEGGLVLDRWYTDPENLFGLALAKPA